MTDKTEEGVLSGLWTKIKNKVKEEVQQFNDMGGIKHAGEYVTQNATSLGVKAAKGLGADKLAESIEEQRETIVQAGKDFDDKVKEEVQQFKNMGGIEHAGEYVTQNATSLGVKAAKGLGADNIAQSLEEQREDIVNLGKTIDARVAAVDAKVKEEAQQFKDMGGVGEYVAENLVSFAVKMDKLAGKEEAAKIDESYRKNFVNVGKAFDRKIQDIKKQLQRQQGEPSFSLLARSLNLREKENKIEPLHSKKELKSHIPYGDRPTMTIKNPEYKNAELLHLSTEDGSTKDVTMIDDKKHGAEITRDANGNITDIKVYDHGKELALNEITVDYQVEERNGIKREYIELNGEIFGTEILTDQNGKTKAAFYEQGGMEIAGAASSKISKKEYTLELPQDPHKSLKEELLAQKGNLENPNTTMLSRSQDLRFDFKLEEYNAAPPFFPNEILGRREKQTETPSTIIRANNKYSR